MFPSRLASVLGGGAALENNYSVDFDGSNDYLDIGATFQSTFRDSFTISMWIKPDDGQPSAESSFFGTRNSTSQDWIHCNLLSGGPAGKIAFYYKSDNEVAEAITSAAVFADGATDWTHLTVVADDVAEQLKIYVNGVSVSVSGGGLDSVDMVMNDWTSSDEVFIGARDYNGAAEKFFDGNIDEVAIYNKILSAGDISALYSARGTADLNDDGNSANLQGWWRMGDGVLDDRNITGNGLIADQVNPTLGADVVVNGDLSSDPFAHATNYSGGWSDTSTGTCESTWSSENQTISTVGLNDSTNRGNATARITTVSGIIYKVSFTNDTTPNNAVIRVGSANSWVSQDITTHTPTQYQQTGSGTFYFSSPVSGYVYVTFSVYDAVTWIFSDVKIEPINSNPGIMTNMASDDIVKDTP